MTDSPILVERTSVFDAVDGEIRNERSILIVDGKIRWIGPAESAPRAEPGFRVIDASRYVAMPGLIDCHVHLAADGSPDFAGQLMSDSVPRAVLRAAASAWRLLARGVTTVRDCGSANDVAVELGRAIDDGVICGPRVIAAGHVITMTGGHCYFIGREADGEDGVRAATRREIKAGAKFIKVMATGGVLTPGVSPDQVALSLEELCAVVQTAHDAERRVTSHAIGNLGIKNALRAGVDSIEHGFHLDSEAVELFLSTGAFLIPTLRALDAELEKKEELPSWLAEKVQKESGYHRESFVAAVEAGVKIAAGTDAGTPFNPPGELLKELQCMVKLGLSPKDALMAATRDAADNLGVLGSVGTLERDKAADVLLVNGDPSKDLRALENVAAVICRGKLYQEDVE